MDKPTPKISVIVTTYNRANLLHRCLDSIVNQTFKDYEIIVVNDCSSDQTEDIIKKYEGLRYFVHLENKGVCAAKNTGLNNIRGEWFAFVDDDDELLPHALETLMNLPQKVNPQIDAITCNCIDYRTGNFSGKGLYEDQYLSIEDIVKKCSGEFWGATKTTLLGSKRFNESIPGAENVVWYKIDAIACRYYLHEGLRIYHTEGRDRVTAKINLLENKIRLYHGLKEEHFYWDTLYQYSRNRFFWECTKGFIFSRLGENSEANLFYKSKLSGSEVPPVRFKIIKALFSLIGSKVLRNIYRFTREL